MAELIQASHSYQPVTLGVLLVLLLAPVAGRGTRQGFALLLALCAVGLGVVAVTQASTQRVLDVVNPFMREGGDEPFLYVTEQVTAPGWQWPLAAAALLQLPALALRLRRHRAPGAPAPIVHATLLGCYVVAARLALEKTAAPDGLVWAVGLSSAGLLIALFVGGYSGARGASFGRFVINVLVIAVLTRGFVTAAGYVATVHDLGTHLDVRVVEDFSPLGVLDTIDLKDASPAERWYYAIACARMMFWALFQSVTGIVLGTVPYLLARRRHATGRAAAAATRASSS